MDSQELLLAGLLLLAAFSIATIVFLLINPYLSGEHRTEVLTACRPSLPRPAW